MIKALNKLDSLIPNWDLDDLIERACPFCMSKDSNAKYLRPDQLVIRSCNICNTFFISPAPSEVQLNKLYSKYDQTFRVNMAQINEFKFIDPMDDYQIQEIASMMDLNGKSYLDIGFGRGYYLQCYKLLGANVYGVELDPDAIMRVKNNIKIDSVIEGSVFDLDDAQKYDVISMNDLIEHPLEPAIIFEKTCTLLNNNGLLSMLTPNASFDILDDQPIAFRKDLEHMQYLSFESCHFLAKKYGLTIVHLETFGYPQLGRIGKKPSRKKYTTLNKKLKNTARQMPGYNIAKKIRNSFKRPERTGRYQLYCIFRKNN